MRSFQIGWWTVAAACVAALAATPLIASKGFEKAPVARIPGESDSPEMRVRQAIRKEHSDPAGTRRVLRTVYSQWRESLRGFLAESGRSPVECAYLRGISAGSLDALLNQMKADPKWALSYERLRPAALMAYAFLRDRALQNGAQASGQGARNAMLALADRGPKNDGENFLDEPAMREELLQALVARVGVNSKESPALAWQVEQTRDYLDGLRIPGVGIRSQAFGLRSSSTPGQETVRLGGHWMGPANVHATVVRFLVAGLRKLEEGAGTRVSSAAKAEKIRGMLVACAELAGESSKIE